MTATLLDSELRFLDQTTRNLYSYAAFYRAGPNVLRVRLRLASTRRESQAVVDLLSGLLTWTVLVDAEPPERPRGEADPAAVATFAADLVARATAILPEADGGVR
jgi:hypothetical protein